MVLGTENKSLLKAGQEVRFHLIVLYFDLVSAQTLSDATNKTEFLINQNNDKLWIFCKVVKRMKNMNTCKSQ